MAIVLTLAVLANLGAFVYHAILAVRRRRLNALLMHLCVQAMVMRNAPIWAAWCGTMGDIQIEISTRERAPSRSA